MMTKEELIVENRHLRDQLLGTRLLAAEMSDDLETVRLQMAKLNLPALQMETGQAMFHLQDMINTLRGDVK